MTIIMKIGDETENAYVLQKQKGVYLIQWQTFFS